MLISYFTSAFRNFRNHSGFAFINLMGLSIGMATFMLIFQYISFERSVNGFHTNLPHLHRILMENEGEIWEETSPGLGALAKEELPEITSYCRIAEGRSLGDGVVALGDSPQNSRSFREQNFAYADQNFFQLFTFEIILGPSDIQLTRNTVALSKSTAQRYFGTENPLGDVLTLHNQFGKTIYTVSSVYADMPQNSDLRYDMVFSLQTLANRSSLNGNDSWARLDGLASQWVKTYLLIQQGIDTKAVESRLTEFLHRVAPESTEAVRIQSLAYQHLPENLNENFPATGNLGFIYLLTAISIIILLIAWFNYVNLSTASSLVRAREVGIRKVVGASRNQLIVQFLGESLILNLVGFLIALALVNLFQGAFNGFIHKDLSFAVFKSDQVGVMGLGFIVLGALASGGYTAFALSSFTPSKTLKGIFTKSAEGHSLRKTLVVLQFTVSTALIASTMALHQQLQFMKNEELGMDISQLMVINGPEIGRDSTIVSRSAGFENGLAQTGFIESFCKTGNVPFEGYSYSTAGITRQNPQPGDDKLSYAMLLVDSRYWETYSIELVAGRVFTEEMGNGSWDTMDKLIANEAAVRLLGFKSNEEAVGQKVNYNNKAFELIGVSADYHHLSLHQPKGPMLFLPRNNGMQYTVKILPAAINGSSVELEQLFKKYFPGNPFDYVFLNDKYQQQYQTEQQYGMLFSIASVLAIFIACLGLFGLATFTAQQRIKEVGIRKVMGASVQQIVVLLSKDFLRLVVLAILIATPLCWYAMNQWLQEFAYRITIRWWIFVISGGIALLISVITISSQAIKSARSNPVKSLRSE